MQMYRVVPERIRGNKRKQT